MTLKKQLNTWKTLNDSILDAVLDLGFSKWSPVQEIVIPTLLKENTDIVVTSQTGTGKTAAYGIPLLNYFKKTSPSPYALILAPTRELCLQITDDLNSFAKYLYNLYIFPIYGGVDIVPQIKTLKLGVNIIVATPGRLLDVIRRHLINMNCIQTIVLDEADKMFNMGFIDEIDNLLKRTSHNTNIWLFSATMPPEMKSIISPYLQKPNYITVGTANSVADNVDNVYYVVDNDNKYDALKRIINYYPNIYAVIFCKTRQITQELNDNLIDDHFNVDTLHGDLTQEQRETVMLKFRCHNVNLLIATDIAARGIDFDNLSHIINYNLPDDGEHYIHRSGRTARAGKHGTAISLINVREQFKLNLISTSHNIDFHRLDIPSGKTIAEQQVVHIAENILNVTDFNHNSDNIIQLSMLDYAKTALDNYSTQDIFKKYISVKYSSLSNFYNDSRDLNIKNLQEITEKERQNMEYLSSNLEEAVNQSNNGLVKVRLNIGHKTGTVPSRIISLINDTVRHKVNVGKIDIFDNYSTIEIDADFVKMVVDAFEDRTDRRYTISVNNE